jgi:tetratricopeptide (TPR) repeat protein
MNDQLVLGLQEHQRGLLAQAVRRYRSVLRAHPDHADALHLLGVALHQQAAQSIGRAVTLDRGNAAYHANLGEAYRALGNLDGAAECNRTALRLQPRSPEAANNLGLVLLAQGKTDEAIHQFRQTLQIKPDYDTACNNLGNALRLGGDLDGALAHFRRAIEIDPHLAEAHSNLGQLLLASPGMK